MQLLTPDEIAAPREALSKALAELDRMLLGRGELHRLLLAGILARGHILLEGLPGLGKTALVKAVADILGISFKRVQFTPDLMPGDILGAHILQTAADGSRLMSFQPGPVFTNILLADEINRASPKTQSAMLEAMQERRVTLLGETRPLPSPFFVLASQNPIELEGTYPLPEAQLDRFLFRIPVGGLDSATLAEIIGSRRRGDVPEPQWRMSAETLGLCFEAADRVFLPRPVALWIARLVSASHPDSPEAPKRVKACVKYGASPRAAIAIAEAARAVALIAGRPSAGFEDVRAVALSALCHRMILNYQARVEGVTAEALVADLLAEVDEANLNLPEGVSVE